MDQQAAAWESYLKQLEQSDPEEYKLLVRDMEEMVARKEEKADIVVKEQQGGDDADGFKPRLPGGKVMDQDGVKEAQDEDGIKVFPQPGFVVKTKTDKDEKIFINVCQSDAIQDMSTKKQLADDGSEQEGLNIPLSLGPPRMDRDKAKKVCIVYDIIVNPNVLKNASEDKTGAARNFLCELALQYVEQKYKCSVDYKYKLPRLDYKGDKDNIPHQMIRKKRAPVIEEVVDVKKPAKQKVHTAAKVKPQQLSYSLLRYDGDDMDSARVCEATINDPTPVRETISGGLICKILVERIDENPKLLEKADIAVSSQFLSVNLKPYYLPLELFLPFPVDATNIQPSYNEFSKVLSLVMPCSSAADEWRDSSKPDPGSRAWLLATALSFDDGNSQGPNVNPAHAPAPPVQQGREEPFNEDTDTLPEDRFHLSDMLSQHIKDERQRERVEKQRRQEEEEEKKKKEEESKLAKEKQEAIQKLLQQAEEQVKNERIHNLDEEDEEDMLI